MDEASEEKERKIDLRSLQELTQEQKVEAIEMMKEDLENNHLEVLAEQWDPLSILDGQWGFKELTREQKQAAEILGFQASWPVVPGYWTGWPFPKEREDPDAKIAWQALGFFNHNSPFEQQLKDPFLSKEAPSFLAATRNKANRVHYKRYWMTMVTNHVGHRDFRHNHNDAMELDVPMEEAEVDGVDNWGH